MKQLILFLLVHTVIFSQEKKNSSILPKKDTVSISMDTIMKPLVKKKKIAVSFPKKIRFLFQWIPL